MSRNPLIRVDKGVVSWLFPFLLLLVADGHEKGQKVVIVKEIHLRLKRLRVPKKEASMDQVEDEKAYRRGELTSDGIAHACALI